MLNERIRTLRLAKGLTLQAVADVFGISRASISSWESGNSNPDHKKLEDLAKLFGCSLQFLLTGKDLPSLTEGSNGVIFIPYEKLNLNSAKAQTSQKVIPLHSVPGPNSFATRYVGHSELNWSPGPIPSGSLIIVDPDATISSLSLLLIQPKKHSPIVLAQVMQHPNNQIFLILDDSDRTQIPSSSKVKIYGVILEWQLSAKTS